MAVRILSPGELEELRQRLAAGGDVEDRESWDGGRLHRAAEADARRRELEEMKQWAKETKVNAPIPWDLLPILAKDPAKQMELAMEHMELGKET